MYRVDRRQNKSTLLFLKKKKKKLVRGVRILVQRRITGSQLQEAHLQLVQFVEEFENLYYQR